MIKLVFETENYSSVSNNGKQLAFGDSVAYLDQLIKNSFIYLKLY